MTLMMCAHEGDKTLHSPGRTVMPDVIGSSLLLLVTHTGHVSLGLMTPNGCRQHGVSNGHAHVSHGCTAATSVACMCRFEDSWW